MRSLQFEGQFNSTITQQTFSHNPTFFPMNIRDDIFEFSCEQPSHPTSRDILFLYGTIKEYKSEFLSSSEKDIIASSNSDYHKILPKDKMELDEFPTSHQIPITFLFYFGEKKLVFLIYSLPSSFSPNLAVNI